MSASIGRPHHPAAPKWAPLIVVVGMTREARIVEDSRVTVIVGGGQPQRLVETLELALARGAAGVMSFGLCGGLDPRLEAGDCVIGAAVTGAQGPTAADRDWTDRLARALPHAILGEIAGGDVMVPAPAQKAALYRETGAVAVDMESHLVARLARRYDTPFAVLRAVSDPACRALPVAAQVGLKADGGVDVGAVLSALLARPGELPALVRTARESGAAFGALRDARHLLGPGLGCPYLLEHPLHMT